MSWNPRHLIQVLGCSALALWFAGLGSAQPVLLLVAGGLAAGAVAAIDGARRMPVRISAYVAGLGVPAALATLFSLVPEPSQDVRTYKLAFLAYLAAFLITRVALPRLRSQPTG